MPRFRIVEVHPMSGWWGAPWIEDDLDGDAFAKLARGICDAYSSALSDSGQQHTVSSLRIFVDPGGSLVPDAPDAGEIVVLSPSHTDRVSEGFEQAAVRVPTGFASWDIGQQRAAVLGAVDAAARGIAEFRGLEPAALERAQAAVLAAGYVFSWTSDWKSSPDRRWRARCSFRTMADGFGRLVLEVSTPDGSLSAASSEQIAWTTIEGYRRAAKTLRWTGPDRVDVVPCIDFLGRDTGVFAVTIEQLPAGLRLRELHQAGLPDGGKKRVHAAAESSDYGADADRRRPPRSLGAHRFAGRPGARCTRGPHDRRRPTNYVPDQYWKTLHALFDQLGAAEWQEWWAPADLPTLEIWWSAEKDGRERLFVRRSTNKMIARIERTSEGLRTADPVRAARDDLAGLMRAVQRRMGLGTPPTLR